ncbi:DUF1656 domain-containing protein [Pseudomonas nicosulfuronedens]
MNMTRDIDLWGVFVPPMVLLALLALGVTMLLRYPLTWVGFYRLVWNRSLFDLALYFIVVAGLLWLFGGTTRVPLLYGF